MTRTDQLAKHIERTVSGPLWHGPVLDELLTGVTAEQAVAKPIAGAHSIWELVLHVGAWAEITRARLDGRAIADPPDEVNFPPVHDASSAAWDVALDRLRESYRDLAARVRQMDDATLDRRIDGLQYNPWFMLHGVVEHGTYHGGQIALLKRALGRTA
jgi:uncharacterized damage-inducible protein DinB